MSNIFQKIARHPIFSTASLIVIITGGVVPIYISRKADAPASADFTLPIQSGKHDLLRSDNVTLALSVTNRNTGQSINANRYECIARETPAGVAVQPVDDTTCSFRLTNAVLAESEGWPVKVDFTLNVFEQSRLVASRSAIVRFHDIGRPLIDAASFRWVGTDLQVRPDIRRNRETATRVALCEWRPADLFVEPTVKNADCTATFRPLPSGPLPQVSVVVTFQAGPDDRFSASATEGVAIMVPPRTPETSHGEPTLPPARQEVTPATSSAAMPAPSLPRTKHQPTDASTALPSALSVATFPALLTALRGTQDDDRYEHLVAGLRTLSQTQRLTAVQVTELLGSLSGALRSTALSRLLPYLRTPLSSLDALALLQGMTSSDRADHLHTLAGCLARPADTPALLAGIYGSERAWIEIALDSAGSCSLSPQPTNPQSQDTAPG